jgi:hypothetical protein
MKLVLLLALLFAFAILAQGNIWDNIFSNFEAPRVSIPQNSRSIYSLSRKTTNITLQLDAALDLGFVKLLILMDDKGKMLTLGTMIFQIKTQMM